VAQPAKASATASNYLTLRSVLYHVRLYGIERIRRICKPPRRKLLFQLPQEHFAFGIACKLNCHATLVVWRFRWRRAKFAATQPPQPWQRRPSQLVNHGWLLLRGRNTKKITRPNAATIKRPIESATKKVRQPSAVDESAIRTAPRQARNSFTNRGRRNPNVATAARSRPQRIALRMEPPSALESTGTR
jgi:hypothetical protein